MGSGPVYVFDLDETLMNPDAMEDGDYNKHQIPDIVAFAKQARATPNTTLLLLTNNGDNEYVEKVDRWLGNGSPFFNAKWDYYNKNRTRMRSKSLRDVEGMLRESGLPTDNLKERVYFFDDQRHMMDKELEDGHKVTVVPSQNDLSEVKKSLIQIGGSKKKTRSRLRSAKRKSRKSKKRKIYRSNIQ